MPCFDCGKCRYSDASAATVTVTITSAGFTDECKPDGVDQFPGVAYLSPGTWQVAYANGTTVEVRSKCLDGEWTYSVVNGGGGGGGGGGGPIPGCDEPVEDETVQTVSRTDCTGYARTRITTYVDGRWVKTVTTITIENNAPCS